MKTFYFHVSIKLFSLKAFKIKENASGIDGFLDFQQQVNRNSFELDLFATSIKTFIPTLDQIIQSAFYKNYTTTYGHKMYFDYLFEESSIGLWDMYGTFDNTDPVRKVNIRLKS